MTSAQGPRAWASMDIRRLAARVLMSGVVATTSTGCYSTWDVAPRSMVTLNGYHSPDEVPLADTSGHSLLFTPNTELLFIDDAGMQQASATNFSSVTLNGAIFSAVLQPNNNAFSINLEHVGNVKAKKFSPYMTALAIGIPIVIVVVALSVAIDLATPSM